LLALSSGILFFLILLKNGSSCLRQGFFSQVGEAALPLILRGENYTIYLQKGKKKLDVNSIFGENCTILKTFSLGKQPYNGPCFRRGKKPCTNSD
jgi:hypothetical protein